LAFYHAVQASAKAKKLTSDSVNSYISHIAICTVLQKLGEWGCTGTDPKAKN